MGTHITIHDLPAYVAEPEGEPRGGLVLIHEIWGLVPHITDVADRWAREGYVVVAPDLLSGVGVDPVLGAELHGMMSSPDESVRLALQPRLRDALAPIRTPSYAAAAVGQLGSVVDYLEEQHGLAGRIAVSGFCFGGTYAFALAAADPRIRAAVPFYGTAPETDQIAAIGCPVLALYGSIDPSLIDALPAVTEAMDAAGIAFTPVVYEGAKHAFFNDTGANFDADAAADAWAKAVAFLDTELR